jgi:hypothetical protein
VVLGMPMEIDRIDEELNREMAGTWWVNSCKYNWIVNYYTYNCCFIVRLIVTEWSITQLFRTSSLPPFNNIEVIHYREVDSLSIL